jgi:hypothetical protein
VFVCLIQCLVGDRQILLRWQRTPVFQRVDFDLTWCTITTLKVWDEVEIGTRKAHLACERYEFDDARVRVCMLQHNRCQRRIQPQKSPRDCMVLVMIDKGDSTLDTLV